MVVSVGGFQPDGNGVQSNLITLDCYATKKKEATVCPKFGQPEENKRNKGRMENCLLYSRILFDLKYSVRQLD